jgi:hypothetical protein
MALGWLEVSAMSCGRARIIGGATLTAGAEAMCYPLLFRRRCLTWGRDSGRGGSRAARR